MRAALCLVAPVACLSGIYLWRNQCRMLMGEICGLWLFQLLHINRCIHNHMQACMHTQWVNTALIWRGYSSVITEFLTCYFKFICNRAHIFTNTQTDEKQTQITASCSLSSPCVSDIWCTCGMKGETYPLLQMVTRPTPNWLSLSWTVKGSGRR